MQFVWWLVGVMASFAAVRFVILVFKRLTSKENMNAILDTATDGAHNLADKIGDYFRERKERRKQENQPIVTIR